MSFAQILDILKFLPYKYELLPFNCLLSYFRIIRLFKSVILSFNVLTRQVAFLYYFFSTFTAEAYIIFFLSYDTAHFALRAQEKSEKIVNFNLCFLVGVSRNILRS